MAAGLIATAFFMGAYYRMTYGTMFRTNSDLENTWSGPPYYGIACSRNVDADQALDSFYRLPAGTPSNIYGGGMNLAGEGFTTSTGDRDRAFG